MRTQSAERNLSMVMDFYEMTMANGYFNLADNAKQVAFDVFYRKIRIMEVLQFLLGWSKSLIM